MNIIETNRLIIREFMPEDSDLLLLYSREEIAKKELPDEVLESKEKATELIKLFKEKYPKDYPLDYPLVYAIESKEAGCMIGEISNIR